MRYSLRFGAVRKTKTKALQLTLNSTASLVMIASSLSGALPLILTSKASADPSYWPSITVTSPTWNTSWQAGSTKNIISWQSSGNVGYVDIEYTLNANAGLAATWKQINTNPVTSNNGTDSYSWTIPADITYTNHAEILVEQHGDPFVEGTSSEFTITAPVVNPGVPALSTPGNGAVLNSGYDVSLDWQASTAGTYSIKNYTVQLSKDSSFKSGVIGTTTSHTYYIPSDLSDGVWNWRVQATDSQGNSSGWSSVWSFTVDTQAPSAPGTPTTTTPTNSRSNSWTWTAASDSGSGVKGYYYQLTGANQYPTSGHWQFTSTTGATTSESSDGSYWLWVYAVDNAGNASHQVYGTLVVDSVAPDTPQLTGPTNGGYYNTHVHDFDFTWSAVTDPSKPVTYDWESSYSDSTTGAGGGFTNVLAHHEGLTGTSLSEGDSPDGTYYWHVRACDAAGNCSAWADPWEVTIDTAAPVITSITPSSGSYVSGTTTWTVNATDTNASYIYVELNHDGTWITDNTQSGTEGATTSTLTYDTTKLAAGTYTIKVDAVDKAGNTTEQDYTYIVDNVKPTVEFTDASNYPVPDGYYNGNFNVEWAAQDNDQLKSVDVSLFDTDPSHSNHWVATCYDNQAETGPSDSGTCTIALPNDLPDGEYYVQIGAQDAAGNWSVNATRTIYIDRTAPVTTSVTAVSSLKTATLTAGTNSSGSTTLLPGAQTTFTANLNDGSGSGVYGAYIELFKANYDGTYGTWVADNTTGSGNVRYGSTPSLNVNLANYSGDYGLKIVSSDNAGNSVTTYYFFTIDNQKPTVAFTDPTPAAGTYLNSDFTVGYTASDNIALKSVNVSLYDTDPSHSNHWVATCYNNQAETGTSDSGTCTVDLPAGLPDGTYYIQVGAQDQAGNWSINQTRTLYIDRTAPDVPTASPNGGDYTSAQQVSLSTTDNLDPSPSIYYTTDGSTPSNTNGTLYTGPITISTDTTLEAIAYDAAGNASSVMTETYGIAPVFSEASLTASTTSVIITWTTNEPATSRVIYDTVSHPTLGSSIVDGLQTYGYQFTTPETDDPSKVTSHSVTVTGLTPGTTYYFRIVSSGSPESVSPQITGITETQPGNGSTTPTYTVNFASNGTNKNTVGGGNGTGVLGATTTTPNNTNSGSNGHVKGAHTTKPAATTVASKKSGKFLGLGWWWLLVLAALGLVLYIFGRRQSSDSDSKA